MVRLVKSSMTNIMYDKLHKHSFKNPTKARRYIDRYIKFIVSRIELNKTRGDIEGHIHHIVPRSWGGTNAKSNLVKLTYKEHIIAHHLLYYTEDPKMVMAFYCMANIFHNNEIKYNLTAEQYQLLCEQARPLQGEIQKAKMANPEIRQKISNSLKGKCVGAKSSHKRAVINLVTMEVFPTAREADKAYGYPIGTVSDGIINRYRVRGQQWEYHDVYLKGESKPIVPQQSSRFKGKKHSAETRKRISELMKGRSPYNNKKVINLQTEQVFNSCTDACMFLGLNRTTMSSSIYHARKRGSLVFSCGGYQWMMYDDYNNGK